MRIHHFLSVQGEGRNIGRNASFWRFPGCPVGCDFCDEQQTPAEDWNPDTIAAQLHIDRATYDDLVVVITGGEPLAPANRENVAMFVDIFHDECIDADLAIETCGAYYDDFVTTLDCITVSPKRKNKFFVDSRLVDAGVGEYKFVADQDDVDLKAAISWATRNRRAPYHCPIWIQPCDTEQGPDMETWSKVWSFARAFKGVRAGIQAHKYWGIE